jgi:FMN reductase
MGIINFDYCLFLKFSNRKGVKNDMKQIVVLSGSPTSHSHTALVLQQISDLLAYRGCNVKRVSVRDVEPETICNARFDDQQIISIVKDFQNADGIVIGSPVYKASYTGVLKALLDLLPQDVFKGTPVLPIMVGGSSHHMLAIEYALKPLLAALKGELLQGVYLLDKHVDKNTSPPISNADILQRIHKQIEQFIAEMDKNSSFVHVKRE